jgi:hypothetical protein
MYTINTDGIFTVLFSLRQGFERSLLCFLRCRCEALCSNSGGKDLMSGFYNKGGRKRQK